MITALNLGAGKNVPESTKNMKKVFLVSVDKMFYSTTSPAMVEEKYEKFKEQAPHLAWINEHYRVREDVYKFLERTTITFDWVFITRFLEHVPFTKVNFFFYLLSTVMKKGSRAYIVIPDYKMLSAMLLNEKVDEPDFEKHNIVLTTEMLNEPYDPHASIWTEDRAKYYGEYEGRFKFYPGEPDHITIDNRDLYLNFVLERI